MGKSTSKIMRYWTFPSLLLFGTVVALMVSCQSPQIEFDVLSVKGIVEGPKGYGLKGGEKLKLGSQLKFGRDGEVKLFHPDLGFKVIRDTGLIVVTSELPKDQPSFANKYIQFALLSARGLNKDSLSFTKKGGVTRGSMDIIWPKIEELVIDNAYQVKVESNGYIDRIHLSVGNIEKYFDSSFLHLEEMIGDEDEVVDMKISTNVGEVGSITFLLAGEKNRQELKKEIEQIELLTDPIQRNWSLLGLYLDKRVYSKIPPIIERLKKLLPNNPLHSEICQYQICES